MCSLTRECVLFLACPSGQPTATREGMEEGTKKEGERRGGAEKTWEGTERRRGELRVTTGWLRAQYGFNTGCLGLATGYYGLNTGYYGLNTGNYGLATG